MRIRGNYRNKICLFFLFQENVYREIIEILGNDENKSITIEDLDKMHLLERCIKETLRLYPIVPLITRSTTTDLKLSTMYAFFCFCGGRIRTSLITMTSGGNYLVKGGTVFLISPYCVHRKRELYENPTSWDPDHFLAENVDKRNVCSFIPFGDGPRGCLG